MSIASLGEFELIARLTRGLRSQAGVELGVGDDCAILDLGGDLLLLITCDSQVEGVHFTMHTSSPDDIGCKALAINLSDIAAMGGEPRYALVSLILPRQLPLAVLDDIYIGLRREAERYGTAIIGGNIAGAGQGEQLIIDITLLGTIERGHAITRSGAQVGDTLCVTGSPGDSATGLYTLLYPDLPYPQNALEQVRAHHRTPRPRIHEGRILSTLGPSVVTAMLDISDGLSGDLEHLCERSHVGARIDTSRLPLSPSLQAIAACASLDPLSWILHGGEDYELLFTVSPANEQAVIEAVQSSTGTAVTPIGTILPSDEGIKLRYPGGHEEPLRVQSWDHLKSET
ncbi:MAG TPA: thiamine-phosphate kinase [Ktedonosporobacter sp.]|nr:thiamine-phosphate kinase [Ktedonosporobacter sp.]